ncbi:MAG: hypothetical protein H0X72_10705 [Acidobacteria bacterium]|nr:hypothetical protein [Acidobacteriota bacterium]
MTIDDNKPVEQTTTSEGAGGYPEAYIRLRTVLDALEMNALYYVLEDEYDATRINRAAETEALLRSCYEQIFMLRNPDVQSYGEIMSEQPATGCPPGYQNCGGVCVPYHCP